MLFHAWQKSRARDTLPRWLVSPLSPNLHARSSPSTRVLSSGTRTPEQKNMSSEPQTTEEVLDEIERLDQSITMVLQDIGKNAIHRRDSQR